MAKAETRQQRLLRGKHRLQARALHVPKVVENRYVLALTKVMRGVHRATLSALKQDTALGTHLKLLIKKPVERALDEMQEGARRASRNALQTISYKDLGLEQEVAKRRQENVELIQGAVDDFHEQISQALRDTEGQTPNERAQALKERAGVSESRAELIARDQTLKTNAGINELRQRNAGVSKYVWSTSHDQRVREAHSELEGKIFGWDDPPVTDDQGNTNHPGEDFQCRCVAVPYFGDEEPEVASETSEEVPSPEPEEAAPVYAETITAGAEEFIHPHVKKVLEAYPLTSLSVEDTVTSPEYPGMIMFGLADSQGNIRLAKDGSIAATREINTGKAIKHLVSDHTDSSAESAQMVLTHEVGHHIHFKTWQESNPLIQEAWTKTRGFRAVSRYATENEMEYFAECYCAYIHKPELLGSVSRKMVEKVLALL